MSKSNKAKKATPTLVSCNYSPSTSKRIEALAKVLGAKCQLLLEPPLNQGDSTEVAHLMVSERLRVIIARVKGLLISQVAVKGKYMACTKPARKLKDESSLIQDVEDAKAWLKNGGMRMPPQLNLNDPSKDKLIEAGTAVCAYFDGTLQPVGWVQATFRALPKTLALRIAWDRKMWTRARHWEPAANLQGRQGYLVLTAWPSYTKPRKEMLGRIKPVEV